ncbi:MAG TPA: hypothetical protein VF516_05500 [Kofleriaceae bacterium]
MVATPSPLKVDPELRHQVFGYWFGPDEDIPDRPIGPPTGAVLPHPGSSFREDAELLCLDLIPIDNYWIVLSELGRYTYGHTSGLLYDEEWVFVPVRDAVDGKWPVRFLATYAESVEPSELAQYGEEVPTRARHDAPAVQLRLRRIANGG